MKSRLLPPLLAAIALVSGGGLLGAPPGVVLSEVHYHPGDDSRAGEFIELENHGTEAADVSGWFIAGAVFFRFPEDTALPAAGRLVVAADAGALAARHGLDPSVIAGSYEGSLSNGSERLELWTRAGYLASFVAYDDEPPWPEEADGLGPSLERISPGREEADPEAWAASIIAGGTPGAPNSAREADPGPLEERTVLVPGGARWRFFRGEEEPPSSWKELTFADSGWEEGPAGIGYGDGDDATLINDMEGRYLAVFARRSFIVEDPSLVTALVLTVDYDDGFIAYVNGAEVARAHVDSPGFDEPASAAHEAGTPEDFPITAPGSVLRAGANVLAIEIHNQDIASRDLSLAPSLEASVHPGPPPEPPPVRPPRDIVINEVFPGEGSGGWVELHNRTGAPLEAGGLLIGLDPPSRGSHAIPAPQGIPARGFLIIPEASLGFSLDGLSVVILATPDGRLIDSVNPRTAPAGMSAGRWPDGSDERFVFRTPTPGSANAVLIEDRVVINEIHYHPGTTDPGGEYIELHNRGSSPVSIGGWSFTKGIEYVFEAGVSIPAGGYVVVAKDPAAAAARHGIPRPHGPFTGGLRNDAETIILRDELKNPADRVRYADEGSWPEEPDGGGPSLELLNPALENRWGPAWSASAGEGTPGSANSRRESDPRPIIAGVEHSPVVPGPGDEVRVTAAVSDERPVSATATLFWQLDSGGGSFQVPMADDGAGDDGVAANGIFGARIPRQAAGTIVLFWIRAAAQGGQSVTAPATAPSPSFLYQVESPSPAPSRPLYRIVMRSQALASLRSRGNNSDVLLDCTFVAGGAAYYNRGVRYRGSSARSCNPLSYRVQFDHDVDLDGIQRLNINGCNTHRQWAGLDFLSRTGIATPECWFRKLSLNGTPEPGLHLRVEAIDESFIERLLPDEDEGGNLYRGAGQANLDYRGEDFDPYRPDYEKHSNEDAADWSDVADLCFRFDPATTSDEDFPEAIEAAVDVDEWALFFAAFAVLGSTENSILLNNGDDYFLYHRPSDGKWILLPWDLDSCFDDAQQTLFRPTVDQIERFLEHPRYAPIYWCHLESLLGGAFLPEVINARIDHLDPLFPGSAVTPLRSFTAARHDFIDRRLSLALTASATQGGRVCGDVIEVSGTSTLLEGMVPGCGTTRVLLGGQAASYDPLTSRWSATLRPSQAGPVSLVAIDAAGFTIARREFTAILPGAATSLPASITSSRTLTASQSPYRLSGPVTVSAGATLTIEPGVTLLFGPSSALRLTGRLDAEGTRADPIVFEAEACALGSAGVILGGAGGHRLAFARITGLAGTEGGRAAAVVLDGADAILEDVHLIGVPGTAGVEVLDGGGLILDRCIFFGGGTAVAASGGGTVTASHLSITLPAVGFDIREAFPGAGPGALTGDSLIVWPSPLPIAEDEGSPASITHSNLDGGIRPGEGNISADPRFLDAASGDLRLSWFSPCRGQGMGGTDMGAVAFEPTGEMARYLRCDTNGDGTNDLSDGVFMLLFLFAGGSGFACSASSDCNGDSRMDITDVIFNLNHLFSGGPTPPAPYPSCEEAPVEACGSATCAG